MLNTYMEKMKKKKIEVFISEDSKTKIKDNANQLGITMGEVIKRALEQYFKTQHETY